MMMPQNAQYEQAFDIETLAEYNLTGGQISLIIKNTAYSVAVKDESVFTLDDFIAEIQKEKSGSFDNDKQMGFFH
jgi:hypothetical protein